MTRAVLTFVLLASLAGCGGCSDPDAPSCPAGLTLCNATCVDLSLDGSNCGACSHACTGEQLCAGGVCTLSCGADRIVCGDVCVSYLTDPANCGACNDRCDAGWGCEVGKCQIQCTPPEGRCGSESAGACKNLQTDPLNCGACDVACASGWACELGSCEIQCAPPLVRCGSGAAGACVTLDGTAHCGNCQTACDASETCRFEVCTTASCLALRLPGPPSSAAAADPVALGSGDFDGDAITDLLVADAAAGGRLLMAPGRGDGTFGAAVVLVPISSPSAIAVGFFDADAEADAVVASSDGTVTTLQPLLGDGAGGLFALADSALDAGSAPQAIALVDLNLDGRPDLLVGDGPGQATSNLRVFLNDGTGLFGVSHGAGALRTANQLFDVGVGVRAIAAGDFDGDGLYPDVVVVWDGAVAPAGEVLLNDGSGALFRPVDGSAAPTHQFPLSHPPDALAVADLDGDLMADWAVAQAAGNQVTFFLAAPADAEHPEAGWPGLSWSLSSVVEPRGLLLQDLDGDLHPDLVTVNAGAGALYYHRWKEQILGAVVFDPPVPLPVGARPVATVLAPVAAAGASYFFTADDGSHDVAATEVLGGGLFGAPTRYPAGTGTSAIALGDFDGDGRLDLATADLSSSLVEVLLQIRLGAPAGTFQEPPATYVLPEGSSPVSMVAAPLESPAKADLAIALEGSSQVGILWGDGAGTFPTLQRLDVGGTPQQVLANDLNGDGILDLVTADMGSDQLTVLLGVGGRAFNRYSLPVGAGPRSVAALRLGPDACTDLVSANATSGTLTILPCDPGNPGLFLDPATVPACPGARSLAVGDFDGDLRADLAVACDAGIAVLRAPGDGTLVGGVLFDAGGAPRAITAADVNADGRPDLLASVPGTGGLAILQGAAGLAFSPPRFFPVGGEPLAAVAADLNGDLRPDVCAAVGNASGAFLGAGAVVMMSGCLP